MVRSRKMHWFKRVAARDRSEEEAAEPRQNLYASRYSRPSISSYGFFTTRRVPRWELDEEEEAEKKRQQRPLPDGKLDLVGLEKTAEELDEEENEYLCALVAETLNKLEAEEAVASLTPVEFSELEIIDPETPEGEEWLRKDQLNRKAEGTWSVPSPIQPPITPEDLRAHKAKHDAERDAERVAKREAALAKANRQRELNGEEVKVSKRKAELKAIKAVTRKGSNLHRALMRRKKIISPIL